MKKNKEDFIKTFTIVILIFCLIFLVIGVSYAVYRNFLKGSTSNVITTGTISFAYTEGDFIGNGIKIENAYPISDNEGKIQFGGNNYFDFNIIGKTTISDVNYEIVVLKDSTSTMNDNDVKIYLTEITNNGELVSDFVMINDKVTTYNDLLSSSRQNGKIVYIGTVNKNILDYNKKFRLRMWINDENQNYAEIGGKNFSIKVNVIAY